MGASLFFGGLRSIGVKDGAPAAQRSEISAYNRNSLAFLGVIQAIPAQ